MPSRRSYVIYHNPRCSKSRDALALLRAQGIEPTIIEYLKTPLTEAELKRILAMLGIPVRDVLRQKEQEYKALGLDNPAMKDAKIIALLAQHPILMERPIVSDGKRAVIGRPTEAILSLL